MRVLRHDANWNAKLRISNLKTSGFGSPRDDPQSDDTGSNEEPGDSHAGPSSSSRRHSNIPSGQEYGEGEFLGEAGMQLVHLEDYARFPCSRVKTNKTGYKAPPYRRLAKLRNNGPDTDSRVESAVSLPNVGLPLRLEIRCAGHRSGRPRLVTATRKPTAADALAVHTARSSLFLSSFARIEVESRQDREGRRSSLVRTLCDRMGMGRF